MTICEVHFKSLAMIFGDHLHKRPIFTFLALKYHILPKWVYYFSLNRSTVRQSDVTNNVITLKFPQLPIVCVQDELNCTRIKGYGL
jgi:hypothetical protein